MKLTESFIRDLADSEESFVRAMEHVETDAVQSLFQNTEGTLYFGKVKDGEELYFPSCYFIDSEGPVYHCGCHSDSTPCWHNLTTLISFARNLQSYSGPAPLAAFCRFDSSPLESLINRVSEEQVKPLIAIVDCVHQFVRTLINKGLFSANHEHFLELQALNRISENNGLQKIAKLLSELKDTIYDNTGGEVVSNRLLRDPDCIEVATDLTCQLQSCIKHNKEFLTRLFKEDISSEPVTQFLNQPWIDWNKDLLVRCGLTLEDAELIQLGFYSRGRHHSSDFDDDSIGFWVNKNQNDIFITNLNSGQKDGWKSDSLEVQNEVVIPDLAYIIPGYFNHGVCWNEFRSRYLLPEDLIVLREKSVIHWESLIDKVKQSWLDPLSDKSPVALLLYESLAPENGELVITSPHNEKLKLSCGSKQENDSVLSILKYLPFELRERQSLLVSFHRDIDDDMTVKPLAIASDREVVRLIS